MSTWWSSGRDSRACGHTLRGQGKRVAVLEAADGIGGVW